MGALSSHDMTVFLFDIGILIIFARFLGEIFRRARLPMVAGEILAGIILGPTVLGTLSPSLQKSLFPVGNGIYVAMQGLSTVSVIMLLLIAGIEIDLQSIWKQRKTAFMVSILGITVPFALGFTVARYFPFVIGSPPKDLVFQLFIGTAMSISALPVIAKTLMDMQLLKSDIGMLIMGSAALNDIVGWIIFTIVISMITGGTQPVHSTVQTIILTFLFIAFMLTAVKWIFKRTLPYLEKKTVWPGGILGFIFAFTMLGSSITEWMGIHAIFGAFLVGIAAGEKNHLTEKTKDVISQVTTNIFAPFFFATIGLRINFAANFDLFSVLSVFVLATVGKLFGCSLGARLSGTTMNEALAIGFGMNARGSMEIILSIIALEFGLIEEHLFVSLVIMAIATSMLSCPMLEYFTRDKKIYRLWDILKPSRYIPDIKARNPMEAIFELSDKASYETGIDREKIFSQVWEREQLMGTALSGGIAVPHARLQELKSPVIIVGKSLEGINFNAPDGAPVNVIFLILTPGRNYSSQLQILAEIAKTFSKRGTLEKIIESDDYEAFLKAIGFA